VTIYSEEKRYIGIVALHPPRQPFCFTVPYTLARNVNVTDIQATQLLDRHCFRRISVVPLFTYSWFGVVYVRYVQRSVLSPEARYCPGDCRLPFYSIGDIAGPWSVLFPSAACPVPHSIRLCNSIIFRSCLMTSTKHEIPHYSIFFYRFPFRDRLCGLVVRVLGYRFGGPGLIPGTTRFSEKKKKKRKQ
jgi:hypothetical protein